MGSPPAETLAHAPLDREIDGLWLAGDPAALAHAHRRYRRRLEAAAYRVLRDRADAEDVVQGVFVAMHRVRARGGASLWTYLYRAAVNGALGLLRSRKRRAELESVHLPQSALADAAQEAADSEQRILEGEMLAAVAKALLRVRPRYREVLTMRVVWNLSNVEIARRQGVPLATVSTRLRRGREELRRHLAPLLRDLGRTSP